MNYNSPFELLIAVILSAQSTDISVNLVTKNLFLIANTPKKILALGLVKIKTYIKSVGLYNVKAQNIIKICQILVKKYQSQIPKNRKELEALPGVGRKTANVILNVVFNRLVIAVDTHIFRLGNRIGIAPGNTPIQVEKKLMQYIPRYFLKNAHYWLILHGRYICTARKPQCHKCVISKFCEYNGKV